MLRTIRWKCCIVGEWFQAKLTWLWGNKRFSHVYGIMDWIAHISAIIGWLYDLPSIYAEGEPSVVSDTLSIRILERCLVDFAGKKWRHFLSCEDRFWKICSALGIKNLVFISLTALFFYLEGFINLGKSLRKVEELARKRSYVKLSIVISNLRGQWYCESTREP